MATESPMRMVETSGAGKWASSKDSPSLASPFNNVAEDELVLLLNGHKFHGDQTNMVVNRSGSAPPCMEGSFVSFRNLIAQQNSSMESLKSALENCQSEEKMIVDPSNLSSYLSNLNLNPRLSPSIRQVGGLSNSLKITSIDDSVYRSFHLSRGSLSTHDEELELDGSPSKSSNDWGGSINTFIPGQDTVYSLGHHKSLVDLIQEDFPRTPSPVYNQSHSSSHGATEEQKIGHDILSHSDSKSSESPAGSVIHDEIAKIRGVRAAEKSLVTSLAKKINSDKRDSSSISPIVEIIKRDADKAGDVLSVGATGSEASRNLVTGEDNTNKQDEKNIQRQIHHSLPQQNGSNQIHEPQAQVFDRVLNLTRNPMDRVHPIHLSSSEAQLVMQPPGLTPPLYATAAAYITSGNTFFPTSYPPGLYAPQYGFGGYTFSSSFLPSFMASYPPHTGMPVHFEANSGQGFNAQGAGASTGENARHIGDRQHLNKFPGQQGLMVHPPFVDPLKMQYFQHPIENGYGTMRQYGHVPTTGVIGAQVESFTSPKESNVGAYVFDQKLQPSPSGSMSIAGPRNGGLPGGYYYGSPQSLNVMSQFSGSPLGSPVPPGSPVGGAIFAGMREISFPQDPTRNVGVYPAWQGQRGFDSLNDPKKHSLLEELKSSNTRKIGLSDITGRIVEFSVDQHGSRFIQQKLENCSVEEKATVFNEVLPHASRLVTDVFGNYVIQKFFEHGTPEQRKELANQLSGQMLPLSLQMYGCRVIQKALEVIELDQRVQLAHELDGNVMRCVQDQNGNHVIQKCIECIPAEKIGSIISAFQGQVATLSTHPYGCRVIQRILEHCSDESHSQCIVDEILESAYVLAQDQYGNYVTQHVLERGKPQERSLIIRKLGGKIVQMSQQKYASNVVEKCLEHGNTSERELLIEEILRQPEAYDHLLTMMKDQFANYVVQKILEISNDKQREVLLKRISEHLHALKKYTYGKHIVARFEQLCGEGEGEDKEAVES